jgi:hypothetical protein
MPSEDLFQNFYIIASNRCSLARALSLQMKNDELLAVGWIFLDIISPSALIVVPFGSDTFLLRFVCASLPSVGDNFLRIFTAKTKITDPSLARVVYIDSSIAGWGWSIIKNSDRVSCICSRLHNFQLFHSRMTYFWIKWEFLLIFFLVFWHLT